MIYLDNAATTKICDEALTAFTQFFSEKYYNPSAVYGGAIEVKNEIEKARQILAKQVFAKAENVFFTSGGTESDNLAILGSVSPKNCGKIITSACEHPAVYNVFMSLKQKGTNVEIVDCDSHGFVDVDKFSKAISDGDVSFCSIMHVNNETGAINDVAKLAKMLKAKNPDAIFHSDGVQGYVKTKLNLAQSQIDLYSMSSHKLNGAKGVGAIYVKNPNKLKSIVFGGGQERNMRSGTENTAGIISFGRAVELWENRREELLQNFTQFGDIITNEISNVENVRINTVRELSSPHILSLSIGEIKGEVLLHMLEEKGIYIGRGSACSTKDSAPRALRALGLNSDGNVRISFGMFNEKSEIESFAKILVDCINELRTKMRKKV